MCDPCVIKVLQEIFRMFMLMFEDEGRDEGGDMQAMMKAMFDMICTKDDDDVCDRRPLLALALSVCALLPGEPLP